MSRMCTAFLLFITNFMPWDVTFRRGYAPLYITRGARLNVTVWNPPIEVKTSLIGRHNHDSLYYRKNEIDEKFEEFTPDLTPIEEELELKASLVQLTAEITALIWGAPTDANTLKKLNDKIIGIQTLLNSDNVNLDNVQELVDAIETIQTSLATILVNDLTTGGVTKALTAEQGKVLKWLIDAIPTGVTPGGNSTNIQTNKNGALYGEDNFSYDDSTKTSDIHASLGSERMPASPISLSSPWTQDATHFIKGSNGTGSISFQVNNKSYERYFYCIEIEELTVWTLTIISGWNTFITLSANGLYKLKLTTLNTWALVITPSNTARFKIKKSTHSYKKLVWGTSRSGTSFQEKLVTSLDHSNYQPGTNDHHEYVNPTGGYIHIPFKFWTTQKSAISALSWGGLEILSTSSNILTLKSWSSMTSQTAYMYLTSSGILSTGYGMFNGKIVAWSQDTTLNAKLVAYGSFMTKSRVINEQNAVFWDDVIHILDTTNATWCVLKSGHSLTPCSSYGSQSACEAKAYLWCYFQVTLTCSDYNWYPEDCANVWCSPVEANCSELWWDEYTCNNTYPCYFSMSEQYCSDYNWDETACVDNSWNWCSPVYDDYDDSNSMYYSEYTDQWTCETNGGTWVEDSWCRWPYMQCDGTIFYSYCEGWSYQTWECGGGTLGSCYGTPSCWNISTQTPCNAETDCEWTNNLWVLLPNSTTFWKQAWWVYSGMTLNYKAIILGTGWVSVSAQWSDKYEDDTQIKTLNYLKRYDFSFFGLPGDCTDFDWDEDTCNNNSWCSPQYEYDEGTMEYIYTWCLWSYIKTRRWFATSSDKA